MTFPLLQPNRTEDVDTGSPHWYISYNDTNIADYGCDTTALVLGQMEYFIILKGDHRAGFQAAIDAGTTRCEGRLRSCLRYVSANKDQLHPTFSDDPRSLIEPLI